MAQYAHDVPDNSPMKLLYLQVYADVLNAAWFDCRAQQNDRVRSCVDTAVKRQGIPQDVTDGVTKALNLYKVSDPIHFQ